MSRGAGFTIMIIGVILLCVSILISSIPVIREEVRIDRTISVSGLTWKSITFYTEGGRLKGWVSSNRPISVYVNYQGDGIVFYDWGAEDVTYASIDTRSRGFTSNTLDIYNPNWLFSATVRVYLVEEIKEYPYNLPGQYLFFFSIILLVAGLTIVLRARVRLKEELKR